MIYLLSVTHCSEDRSSLSDPFAPLLKQTAHKVYRFKFSSNVKTIIDVSVTFKDFLFIEKKVNQKML